MTATILRRYTQLTSLLYLLSEQRLTLLDPSSWDDKNDSYFLQQYREKRRLKTVLALCFSTAQETYHHWSVFADGSAGVCIQFNQRELVTAVGNNEGISYREVNYLPFKATKGRKLKIRDLPFTKRYPFQDESEWRIIYESETERKSTHDIRIPLSSVERITLSPWLPEAHKEQVKQIIWAIEDCEDLDITRSTLISNERWKKMGEEAV